MRKPLILTALLLGFFAGSIAARAQSADVTVLCYHDVRDNVGGSPVPLRASIDTRLEITPDASSFDADQYAISTRNLASQFDWLREHGYHVISLQQLIDVRQGHGTLRKNAVLITFDDGLRSAHPDGTGAPSFVYFPNSELPLRSDLFSRTAWQLRTRCGMEIYAWMPVLAWQLPDRDLESQLQIQSKPGVTFDPPVRLNPFLPGTREIVGNLYEDVRRSAPNAGILFSDDAVPRDTDVLGSQAPAPGSTRTNALIDFTDESHSARAPLEP